MSGKPSASQTPFVFQKTALGSVAVPTIQPQQRLPTTTNPKSGPTAFDGETGDFPPARAAAETSRSTTGRAPSKPPPMSASPPPQWPNPAQSRSAPRRGSADNLDMNPTHGLLHRIPKMRVEELTDQLIPPLMVFCDEAAMEQLVADCVASIRSLTPSNEDDCVAPLERLQGHVDILTATFRKILDSPPSIARFVVEYDASNTVLDKICWPTTKLIAEFFTTLAPLKTTVSESSAARKRLDDLAGKVLGLLNNGAEVVLDRLPTNTSSLAIAQRFHKAMVLELLSLLDKPYIGRELRCVRQIWRLLELSFRHRSKLDPSGDTASMTVERLSQNAVQMLSNLFRMATQVVGTETHSMIIKSILAAALFFANCLERVIKAYVTELPKGSMFPKTMDILYFLSMIYFCDNHLGTLSSMSLFSKLDAVLALLSSPGLEENQQAWFLSSLCKYDLESQRAYSPQLVKQDAFALAKIQVLIFPLRSLHITRPENQESLVEEVTGSLLWCLDHSNPFDAVRVPSSQAGTLYSGLVTSTVVFASLLDEGSLNVFTKKMTQALINCHSDLVYTFITDTMCFLIDQRPVCTFECYVRQLLPGLVGRVSAHHALSVRLSRFAGRISMAFAHKLSQRGPVDATKLLPEGGLLKKFQSTDNDYVQYRMDILSRLGCSIGYDIQPAESLEEHVEVCWRICTRLTSCLEDENSPKEALRCFHAVSVALGCLRQTIQPSTVHPSDARSVSHLDSVSNMLVALVGNIHSVVSFTHTLIALPEDAEMVNQIFITTQTIVELLCAIRHTLSPTSIQQLVEAFVVWTQSPMSDIIPVDDALELCFRLLEDTPDAAQLLTAEFGQLLEYAASDRSSWLTRQRFELLQPSDPSSFPAAFSELQLRIQTSHSSHALNPLQQVALPRSLYVAVMPADSGSAAPLSTTNVSLSGRYWRPPPTAPESPVETMRSPGQGARNRYDAASSSAQPSFSSAVSPTAASESAAEMLDQSVSVLMAHLQDNRSGPLLDGQRERLLALASLLQSKLGSGR
ncbi:uncharacterized protein BJ171DRAFT_524378 [Polychytrium aggregatum]|uniref:uncharacterized protein n=1 Tax=Polychytrium aggregatum TaxID=110093 RepID=UPI0022FE5179|nr:uncharacterized protein BJ171DRAFT_524378 [Polychytrium aggregatum]KAI9193739.1 hypothetical protein BJ171DRAFT_524378 [Polychytrium aggregatum]